MSENNEQVPVSNEPAVCEGEEAGTVEKLVPVSEAIRYRRRAQAAEKELGELKASYDKQERELAALKEQAPAAAGPAANIPAPAGQTDGPVKTQGVKEARTTGTRTMLQQAAKQAAGSGSRADVQEYLRLRRAYV